MSLSGCAGKNAILHNHLSEPKFDFFSYFEGEVIGTGMVLNWRGHVIRQFTVVMQGSLSSQHQLVIDESFVFNNGEKQSRQWVVSPLANNEVTGKANDTIGNAQGRMLGNTMNWRYRLKIPYRGRSLAVDFDDWMYLQQDKRYLINKVTMRKFGLPVGSLVICFDKKAATP